MTVIAHQNNITIKHLNQNKMRKIIEFLFSDTMYTLLLVLFGAYLVSQEKYSSAYIVMATFIIVAVRREVKNKSE